MQTYCERQNQDFPGVTERYSASLLSIMFHRKMRNFSDIANRLKRVLTRNGIITPKRRTQKRFDSSQVGQPGWGLPYIVRQALSSKRAECDPLPLQRYLPGYLPLGVAWLHHN